MLALKVWPPMKNMCGVGPSPFRTIVLKSQRCVAGQTGDSKRIAKAGEVFLPSSELTSWRAWWVRLSLRPRTAEGRESLNSQCWLKCLGKGESHGMPSARILPKGPLTNISRRVSKSWKMEVKVLRVPLTNNTSSQMGGRNFLAFGGSGESAAPVTGLFQPIYKEPDWASANDKPSSFVPSVQAVYGPDSGR